MPPVLTLPEMLFGRMMHLSAQPSTAEYLPAGELFALYAHLFTDIQIGSPHVRRVENYIRSNYMHPIRVEQIARDLSLDRRYLSRIFKGEMGCSIQEYLIRARLEAAERLLLRGCSVKEPPCWQGTRMCPISPRCTKNAWAEALPAWRENSIESSELLRAIDADREIDYNMAIP